MTNNVHQLMRLGLFTTVALILGLIELRLPFWPVLPGLKLGLANLATLLALDVFNARGVLAIVIARTCLAGLLGGGFGPAFAMSLSAGLTSAAVMLYAYRHWQPVLSIVGVSVAGALMHNFTQITVAALLVGSTGVYGYLPYLVLAGTLAGTGLGYAAALVISRLPSCGSAFRLTD